MMKELGLEPYRPRLLHALTEDDPDRRCEFVNIFLNLLTGDSSLIELFGQMKPFSKNPHVIVTQEMNASGIIVWTGIWVGGSMLKRHIVAAIASEMDLEEAIYMHNGALAHYARSIDWPPRSPDLTPTDFFLLGVLKECVYATKPQNLQALQDAMITEIQSLPVKIYQSACHSVSKRLQPSKDFNDEHIEQFF
ncbi:unnamed protein product [Adineta ricciae]|uniref:Uncharacterized protein n=1 Tax=Adineta ricciae TaxID=249248 RepID=A0A816C777_ADIRI|nr:unnamed protein product [Adineta ricciae]CAF1618214.1 unnamed protein product [Adineta ricciae]